MRKNKSIRTSKTQSKKKVGKGKSLKKKRPGPIVLSPSTFTELMKPQSFSKKNSVKYSLEHMQKAHIDKIYNGIRKENIDFTFDCKVLEQVHGRDMVKITSINSKKIKGNLVFYRSSGKSRQDTSIKNIWFPCGDKSCVSPISKRITKAENKYLLNNSKLVSQVNKESNTYNPTNNTPYLSKYGRFINKTNAIISRLLGNGFVCES